MALSPASLFYPRGFLITKEDLLRIDAPVTAEIDRYFNACFSIADWRFYTHPSVTLSRAADGDISIVVLGFLIDPQQPELSNGRLAQDLAGAYRRSEEHFFGRLEELSGRFLIWCHSPGKAFVLQDPAGTRSVVYADIGNACYVASHEHLIAECLRRKASAEGKAFAGALQSKRIPVKYFPGTRTLFDGISALTPNTLLDLNTFRPRRFFPRTNLIRRDAESVADEVGTLLSGQLAALSRREVPKISLTSGLDSRTTLAAARKVNAEYFTFCFSPAHREDADGAAVLAANLGLKHDVLTGESEPQDDEDFDFLQQFHRITSGYRSPVMGLIARRLSELYPFPHIHVKSNVAEIGHAVYQAKLAMRPRTFNAGMLAKIFFIAPHSPFCISAFQDYITQTSFTKARSFNYEFYDLFYWEHRMGRWQSAAILEFDFVHDTFIPYNHRGILKLLLSVRLNERINGLVQQNIIRNLWPQALKTPIQSTRPHSLPRKLMRTLYLRL